MSWRFYAGWGIVVALAFVLPVAIPYAVWPDYDSRCARYAKGGLGEEHRRPFALMSVRVLECGDDEIPWFRAEITFHGPYGVPTDTYLVTSSDTGRLVGSQTGFHLVYVAYVAGAAAVSMPFAFVLLRRTLRADPLAA
jgi:hypothetical protein